MLPETERNQDSIHHDGHEDGPLLRFFRFLTYPI